MKKAVTKKKAKKKEAEHIPAMLNEVVGLLEKKKDVVIIDCTMGTGGHTLELAKNVEQSTILAMDLDEDQIDYVLDRALSEGFKAEKDQLEQLWGWKLSDKRENTLYLVKSDYTYIKDVCDKFKIKKADLVLFDLGFSTYQLVASRRGFSYATEEEEFLDQRYDALGGWRAVDLLARMSRSELAKIFEEFGEERYADEIAQAIVETREVEPVKTNKDLVDIIRKTVGSRYERGKHPAMRVFQALRIAVNNELVSLAAALPQAFGLIAGAQNGKLAAITFQSLERRVISKFVEETEGAVCGKPMKATLAEVSKNPKAHNAEMYVITAEDTAKNGSQNENEKK